MPQLAQTVNNFSLNAKRLNTEYCGYACEIGFSSMAVICCLEFLMALENICVKMGGAKKEKALENI